ncbi:hypothetical protein FACS189434_03880 [Bacteroidia bacterium]|nr:hypothetical protein FACS189434_03880 [Bacteroidia bacterium]
MTNIDFAYTDGAAPARWDMSHANTGSFAIDEGSYSYMPTGNFANQKTVSNSGTNNNTKQYAIVKNPNTLSTQYANIPVASGGMLVLNPKQGNDDVYGEFIIGGLIPGNSYTFEIKLWNVLDLAPLPGNSGGWYNWNNQLKSEYFTNNAGDNHPGARLDWTSSNGSTGSFGSFGSDQNSNMMKTSAGGTSVLVTGTISLRSTTQTPESQITMRFYKGGDDNPVVLGIEYIKIYGCEEEAIVTSTGASDGGKICETSAVTLTAQGLGPAGSTYTWTQQINGGAVTTLPGTAKSITVTTPAGKDQTVVYKAVGAWSTKTLTLKTALCCYDVGDRTTVLEYDFSITPESCNPNRGKIQPPASIDASCVFSCTGGVQDQGGYAIIKSTNGDGHWAGWQGHAIDEHTAGYTGKTGTGMLAINMPPKPTVVFEYDLPASAICDDGASYQFSAWFASADPQNNDPCNISFQVIDAVTNAVVEQTTTGNFGYSADHINHTPDYAHSGCATRWKQTTLVFTTELGKTYKLRLVNNSMGIAGNDVLIDDILITKCSPKIDFFPDGTPASAEEAEVCSSSAIHFNIEVPVNAATPGGSLADLFPTNPTIYYQLQVCDNYNVATGTGTWALVGTPQTTANFNIIPTANNKWYRVKITADPATAANTNPPSITCGVLEFYTRMFRIKLKDALNASVSPTPTTSVCLGGELTLTGITTETGVEWGWKKGANPAIDPFITGYELSSDPLKKIFTIASYAAADAGDYYFFVKKDDCENWAKVTVTTKPKPVLGPIPDQIYCSPANVTQNFIYTPAGPTTNWSYTLDGVTVPGATSGTGNSISARAYTIAAGRTTAGEVKYKAVPVSADGCTGDTVSFSLFVSKLVIEQSGAWQTNAAYGETVTLKVDTSKTALPAGGSFEYLWERQQILPAPPVPWATLPTQTTATLTDIPNNGSGTYVYRVTVFMKKGSTTYCSPLQLLDTVKVSNLMGRDTTLYFCPGEVITYTGKGKTVSGLPLDEWIWWKAGTTPPLSGNTNPTDSTLVTPALTVADSAAVWNYRIFKGGEFIDVKLTLLKKPNFAFIVADNPTVVCKNTNVTLTATASGASASAANKLYNWDGGGDVSANTYTLPTTATGTGLSFVVTGKADGFCQTPVTVNYEVVELVVARNSVWTSSVFEGQSVSLDLTTAGSVIPTGGKIGIKWEKSTNPAGAWTVIPGETAATLTNTPAAAGSCYRATATLYKADNSTVVCTPIDTIIHCVDVITASAGRDTTFNFCAGDSMTIIFTAINIDAYVVYKQGTPEPSKTYLSALGDTTFVYGIPRFQNSDDGSVWNFKIFSGPNSKTQKITFSKNPDYAFTLNPDKVYTCIGAAGSTTTITASGTGTNPVYQWAAGNGQTGTGATFALNTDVVACGTIAVAGKADGRCYVEKTIPYLINDLQVSAISASSATDYVCKGTGVTLAVSVSSSICSTETFEIEWKQKLPSATTWTIISTDATSVSKAVTPAETTQYQVTIRAKQGTDVVCEVSSAVYTLNVVDVQVGADELNKEVCDGGTITLTGTVLKDATAWHWEDATNTPVSGATAQQYITPVLNATVPTTVTYYFVAENTNVTPACTARQRFDVRVKPYIAFSVDKTNIEACKGDVVSITANSSNASGVSYSWKVNGVDKGVSNPFTVPTNIEGFGTIVVSASANDYCSPAAISIPFNISKFEVSEIQSSNDWFCMGKNVTLGITIDGTYTNVLWSANGVPDASKDGLLNVTFTPVGETTYRVEVQHNVCPARTKQKIIKEANAQIAITPRDTAICIGDEIILRADTLDSFTGSYIRWEKITPDSTQFIDNNYFIRQRPSETTIFRATLLKSGCDPSDEITVKINPLPEVTDVLNDVILQEMKKIMQTTFVVAGEQPISYWVDDTTLYAKGYNVFLDLKVGSHILYVTDDNGCKTNLSFDVPEVPLDIPIFFSPNDDGLYDTWLIPELRLYKRIDLRIFDRFGKELEWTTNSEWDGWNGKYMSKKLPSDDYWYVLTIEDTGKKYVGHFTLINKK